MWNLYEFQKYPLLESLVIVRSILVAPVVYGSNPSHINIFVMHKDTKKEKVLFDPKLCFLLIAQLNMMIYDI